MASDLAFVEYLHDQLAALGGLTHRKMFGEFALYRHGKVVAFVCDNQLFVKPTEAGASVLGTPVQGFPYPGAKPHFLVTDLIDDRERLCQLLHATWNALPEPKPKTRHHATTPPKDMTMPTRDELAAFLKAEFPQTPCRIESVGQNGATIRHPVGPAELRPGGTVSGPVMMTAADVALYVAILGRIGIVPLAVTTSLTFNFLRKPAADRDILAECRLLKVGRVLIVGEVSLYSEGQAEPVAHAVGTYSIPPAPPPAA